MMTKTTRWWLIRHAPVINPEGKVYGQSDIEANVSDTASFAALAAALPKGAIWHATQLSRTQATAAAIVRQWTGEPPPPPEPVPAFIEQNFGAWQGLSHADTFRLTPRPAHQFWLAPATRRPPGGESFAEVVDRVRPALIALSETHAARDVVTVMHGGTIRAALTVALGIEPEAALSFSIDTLSLTRIDAIIGDGPVAWRVAGVNLPPGAAR